MKKFFGANKKLRKNVLLLFIKMKQAIIVKSNYYIAC